MGTADPRNEAVVISITFFRVNDLWYRKVQSPEMLETGSK